MSATMMMLLRPMSKLHSLHVVPRNCLNLPTTSSASPSQFAMTVSSISLDHILDSKWRGRLHGGAILALQLYRTELNAGRLTLLSSSSDAQLLMTRFEAPAAVDFGGAELGITERRTLNGPDGGGPIFSLGIAPHHDLLLAGNAEREVRAWRVSNWNPVSQVVLGGHTGWVRTLSICSKFMISAACNFIKVWELPGSGERDPIPHTDEPAHPVNIKYLCDLQLYKGDVLVTAVADGRIYGATADGMLHIWTFSSCNENLRPSLFHKTACVQVHEGRVGALAVQDKIIVTASQDGIIRVWCGVTMQMKAEAQAAHGGSKIHALATLGNLLFSGGGDKCVRIWNLETIVPIGEPLLHHTAAVRSLVVTFPSTAQGTKGLGPSSIPHSWLASGDANGEVILWRVLTDDLDYPSKSLP